MMQRQGLMAAVFLCATTLVAAQTPSPTPPLTRPGSSTPRPADERTTTRDGATPTLTVEGCLGGDGLLTSAVITGGLPQAQRPGATTGTGGTTAGSRPTAGMPDTPERGGAGTSSPGSPRVGEENPAGTRGLGTDPQAVDQTAQAAQSAAQSAVHTFKLDGLKDEQLRPHVGARVRVTGTVDMTSLSSAGASRVGSGGTAKAAPVVELEATAITPLGGRCSR
jgi:hypothetical protein